MIVRAPCNQSRFLFTVLKIVLSLFFIVQLIIIALLFMIAIFQHRFESLFDLFITFALTWFGICFESLPILISSNQIYGNQHFVSLTTISSRLIQTVQEFVSGIFGHC